jgi:competence protein ComEC
MRLDSFEQTAGHAGPALYQNTLHRCVTLQGGFMLYSFSFFGGVAALLASPGLPSRWLVIALVLLAFAGALCAGRLRAARVVCGCCCGFLFAAWCARDYLAHRWPESLADERVIASVVVDSIPAPLASGWAFDGVVRIERPERPPVLPSAGVSAGGSVGVSVGPSAAVSVGASADLSAAAWGEAFRARLVTRDEAVRPHAGERWRLLLSLRAPRGRANPGAPDFERHQFRDGVHALGTVLASRVNERLDEGHRPLDQLRERISERVDAQVTDRDAAALIAALAVGDTGRVSREQWRVFNATGTTHLVAISGMHVTLFAVIMFALARRAWMACVTLGARRSARRMAARGAMLAPATLSRRVARRPPLSRPATEGFLILSWVATVPRENFAAAFGFVAAAAYAALAGLSVPTERTLIMLGAWLFARSIARASHPFQPFALALLLVLLIDPFAPLSAGFWLSFAAMAAIILSATGRFMRLPLWREALSVQVVVSIALLPFSLALFGSIPLIGLPVNLLAIPAMSWVLVPTVLLAVALLPVSNAASNAVLSLAEWLHNLGWPWLAAASDSPWALIHASPPWWWYALAVIALAMAALPWPLLMRLAALICVAPLAASIERPLKQGEAEITALDVGEGASVVVRTASHVLVYGTGDSYGTDGRIADSVVIPFLRSSGSHAIDRLVIPHATPASGAGVVALLAEMPIKQILLGDPGAAIERGTVECPSMAGSWQWDGVTLTLGGAGSGHACSLSVRSAAGDVRIPGDIAVMVVETSDPSTPPHRWVVVSSRRMQRAFDKYARSHPDDVQGAEVLTTADLGAIRVPLDSTRGPEVPETYRAHRRTLWSGSP